MLESLSSPTALCITSSGDTETRADLLCISVALLSVSSETVVGDTCSVARLATVRLQYNDIVCTSHLTTLFPPSDV